MATTRNVRRRAATSTNGQIGLPAAPAATEHLDIAVLETWLWDAACAVRGADAPKFKDVILPLVFFKRISDVFDDEFARHVEEWGDEQIVREVIEADHEDAVHAGLCILRDHDLRAIRNHPAGRTLKVVARARE